VIRSRVILILVVVVLITKTNLYCQQLSNTKDEAVAAAFKEEAVRQAFQEAEIKLISGTEAKSEGGVFAKLPSYLHPYLDAGINYNDNIWRVEDDVRGDLFFNFRPGLKFILGEFEEPAEITQQQLSLDLGALIVRSLYRSVDLNREAPYFELAYNFGKGRNKINFKHNFERGYDLSSSLRVDIPGLSEYLYNGTDLSWEYSFNRLGLELGYSRRSQLYYKNFKARNTYIDNMAVLTGFFKISPKTRIFAEYNYGRMEYDKAPTDKDNYDYNNFWIGARGNLTRKLTGLVKFGFQNHQYDKENRNSAAVQTDLSYKLSPKDILLLNIGYGERDTGYVDEGNDKYFQAKLGIGHAFTSRLSLYGAASYVKDDYDSGRHDDTYHCSLKLDYAFREWMKIGLGYDYRYRLSNKRRADYRSNGYFLRTEVAF